MRTRALLLCAALVPSAAISLAFAPAPAAEGDDCGLLDTVDVEAEDGTVSEQDVLACAASAYLAGCDEAAGGKVYHQLVQGNVPLTATAPEGSFTAGAGCGTYEEPLFQGIEPGNPFYDFTVEGFVFGNIDELTVELHDIYVADQRAGGEIELQVRLEVDGESLFGTEELTNVGGDTTATTPRVVLVPVTPEVSDTGVSEALRFSIGDLYARHGIVGRAGDGADAFHSVRLTVSVPPGVHALVWGANEIPSGFYFNQGLQGTVLEYGTGNVAG